ncbi:pilus assembly protein PilP [Vibrio sp.]|uniref:pilus assembly protein PilP n=1 Tax=Vibrio sp. TaxID=678 RepID=UPI00311E292E
MKKAKVIILLCGFLSSCKANQDPLSLESAHISLALSESTSDFSQQSSHSSRYDFDISSELRRDPFSIPETTQISNQCQQSDNAPTHTPINFPLDDLRLAGVVHRRTDYIALIELPNGALIKGVIGQEIGLNQDMITNISSDMVTIGRWAMEYGQCRLKADIRLTISR